MSKSCSSHVQVMCKSCANLFKSLHSYASHVPSMWKSWQIMCKTCAKHLQVLCKIMQICSSFCKLGYKSFASYANFLLLCWSHIQIIIISNYCRSFLDQYSFKSCSLQMFCLQNTQMFVCVLNSRTNTGCFYIYRKSLIRSQLCIILDSDFPRLVLKVIQKVCILEQIFF